LTQIYDAKISNLKFLFIIRLI